jgi:TonB family protein
VDHTAVSETNGVISIKSPSGVTRTISSHGRDSQPSLTADGKTVLYVRSSPDDLFDTAIYEISLGSTQERLVFQGPVTIHGRKVNYFGWPQLDKERNILCAVARHSVTSGTLFAADLKKGLVSELTDVVGFDLIRYGQYRGDLLALQRFETMFQAPATYFNLYVLLSPEGKQLAIAGTDRLDITDIRCPNEDLRSYRRDDRKTGNEGQGAVTGNGSNAPIVEVDAGLMQRRLKSYVAPVYPSGAIERGITGIVRVLVTISPSGDVSAAKLISGHPELAQAALTAVRKWTYNPWVIDGHAVFAVTTVRVPFGVRE